jgi:site-specific recombinase XerC
MVTLTRDQAAKLLEAAQRRPLMRTLVMLGVATGARLGELLALTWPDIDLQAGTLRIGRSRRIVNRRMQVKGPKTEAGYRLASRPGLSPAASSSAAAVSVPTPGSANRSGATFSAASPAARMRRSESAEQNGGNVADRRWRGGDGSVVTLPHPI